MCIPLYALGAMLGYIQGYYNLACGLPVHTRVDALRRRG